MTKSEKKSTYSRNARSGRFLELSAKSGSVLKGSSSREVSAKGEALPSVTYTAVKSGLPAKSVKRYVETGRLKRDDVALVIPRRTFERRLAEGQALKVDEADAIARLLRVRDHARAVFKNDKVADEWLRSENPALDGEVPIHMARTDVGAREVVAVLTRFAHGVYG